MQAIDDDAFLDDLFERSLARLLEGGEPDPAELVAGRAHLIDRARETVELARAVAGSRSGPGALAAAREVGGFELVQELGRGASSIVYLARQRAVGDRLVALKLLAQGPFSNARARRRFAAEVRALARVRHPNVVPVLDVVEDDGVHGYAMEWVRGSSLADLIRRHREGSSSDASDPAALDEARYVPWVCRTGVQLGRALQAVHDEGLLHRDVKPSNVLIGDRGEAMLSDFGLVHDEAASLQTRTGDFLGTLAYSAPEQLRGVDLDARADVYGLGATIYHALTAAVPARGQNVTQVLGHLEGRGVVPLRRVRPRLPRDLETVVQKAMAVEPQRRYASAADFADDLQRVLDLEPVHARRPGVGYRALRFTQRNRAVVSGIVVGAMVVIAVLLLTWWQQHRSERLVRELGQRVEDARLSLFDSRLSARMRAQVRRGRLVSPDRTRELLDISIAAYDRALALSPGREDLRLERATLEVAGSMLARFAPPAMPEFSAACPTAWAFARGEARALGADAAIADARALAVLAYLAGDLDTAVAALELVESQGAADSFSEGLLGAVLAARGEPERALPRMLRMAERFPERGGLQVEAALVAAACGDVPLTARLLGASERAAEAPQESGVRLVRGDLAWLRGDHAAAERHYQAMNGYDRMLLLWTSRREWQRAIVGALNYIPIEPKEPRHRQMLLASAEAWWGERTATERRELLVAATAGELCNVGHLFGLFVGFARARELLRTVDRDPVLPILAPVARRQFDGDLLARARGPLGALVERMQVRRLDLLRLTEAPSGIRARLVDAWLDPGGAAAAAGIVESLAAWIPAAADPFALAVDRPLPAPLVDCVELSRPSFSLGSIWVESAAMLHGPEPRILVTGAASDDAEEAAGVVALLGLDGRSIARIHGREPTSRLGGAVANVGDIDGDRYDDGAIGTSARVATGKPEQVLLVSGRNGEVLHVLTGDDPVDAFGKIAVGLGDVDGDGTTEIAVAATQASYEGRSRCGVVRVVGVDGVVDHVLAGRRPMDAYGQDLAAVGDVDGDGANDFAIGTECQTPPLYAEVRSGRTGELLFDVQDATYPIGKVTVAGPGDIDGDDVPDVLVGFSTLEPWRPPAGRVDFISGRTGERFREVTGDRLGEGFALAIEPLGDLDGDGRGEFGVAASCEVSALPPTVYVFSLDGRRLAKLPGVWRLLPAAADGRLAAVTISVWSRYAETPMASGGRVVAVRWPR